MLEEEEEKFFICKDFFYICRDFFYICRENIYICIDFLVLNLLYHNCLDPHERGLDKRCDGIR